MSDPKALAAADQELAAIMYRIGCTVNVEQIAYYLVREGVRPPGAIEPAVTSIQKARRYLLGAKGTDRRSATLYLNDALAALRER